MKKIFIKDFEVKQTVDSSFLVKYIAVMESKDGKTYLNIILSDSTGTIEARKWHDAEDVMQKVHCGDVVDVIGKVNLFQNKVQLIIQDITRNDSSQIDMSEFIPSSVKSSEVMFENLLKIIEGVNDKYIKELLVNILFDSEIARRMKIWPAGKTIHHAYQGGLLEHTLKCAKVGVHLADLYNVNYDILIAGLILHDIGKIYELTDGPVFDYTEEGKLIGHVIKSVEVFEKFVSRISDFPRGIRLHLKHIILSHHGEYEYGSAKLPSTKEAFLVNLIDQIDSKMYALEEITKNDNTQGNWSGYVKHLDRAIFKGDIGTYMDYQSEIKPNKFTQVNNSNDPNLKYSMADKLKDIKIK